MKLRESVSIPTKRLSRPSTERAFICLRIALEGETVEEPVACLGDGKVVDGIVSGIRPELVEHLGVVVADGSDVELLGPAGLGVHNCHIVQESAAELVYLAL